MMKTIGKGMRMGGLEENIILVLIPQLRQALMRQQLVTTTVAIITSIEKMLRQVPVLVRQLMVVVASIMIVLRQVLVLVRQLVEAEQPQQVLVRQQLVVDQRQQVQAAPLQADLLFYFSICSSIKRQL
jgi:hypothetical protein